MKCTQYVAALLVTAGLAVQAGAALAQTAAGQDAPAQPPAADGDDTTAITVTARRRSEALKDVPVSVSALSAEGLEQRQIATQQDLQRAVPGFVVRPLVSSNSFNFAMRGQSVDLPSGSQPAVLPYVNEFQTTALGPGSLFDLASIQVLKGHQGTLFGRNTTGGAVLFTTQKPDFDGISGFLKIDIGNYNRHDVQAAINIPVSETLALRVAGDRTRREGFVRNIVNGDRLNAEHRDAARLSATWKPTSTFTNDLVVESSRSRTKGDADTIYSAYALGALGPAPYNIPLQNLASTFYTPFLDQVTQTPGSYAALLATLPAAAPACGIVCFAEQQQARGPWKVALNPIDGQFSKSHGIYIIDTAVLALSDTMQVKNIIGFTNNFASDYYDADGSPFPLASNILPNRPSSFRKNCNFPDIAQTIA